MERWRVTASLPVVVRVSLGLYVGMKETWICRSHWDLSAQCLHYRSCVKRHCPYGKCKMCGYTAKFPEKLTGQAAHVCSKNSESPGGRDATSCPWTSAQEPAHSFRELIYTEENLPTEANTSNPCHANLRVNKWVLATTQTFRIADRYKAHEVSKEAAGQKKRQVAGHRETDFWR